MFSIIIGINIDFFPFGSLFTYTFFGRLIITHSLFNRFEFFGHEILRDGLFHQDIDVNPRFRIRFPTIQGFS